MGKEKVEEVCKFRYLGTDLCKHGTMEEDMREIAVEVRQMIDTRRLRVRCWVEVTGYAWERPQRG